MLAKRGGYFDRILLPVSQQIHMGGIAAGFCVVCLCVLPRQSDYAQVNLSALRIFSRVAKSAERIESTQLQPAPVFYLMM